MSEELVLNYIDTTKMTSMQLRGIKLEDQIDKLVKALKHVLDKMKDMSEEFKITEFTVNVGVEVEVLILKADGGIEIKWERC
jgi:hypothetical protein